MTGGNTALDAFDEAISTPVTVELPEGDFGLVNIHRFETLLSDERKASVRTALLHASEHHRLQIVNHATTRAWLETEKDFTRDLEKNGAVLLPRQSFLRFAAWLAKSKFVICDSGGNQQECDYIGKPCLLMRAHAEQAIDKTRRCVVLSEFDQARIEAFVANPESYAEPMRVLSERPSDIIWKALAEF
jgi:UDP-N-acetylglucosamine 2-epimerase (non-hydrolysing)